MDRELTFEERLNRFIEATEKSSAEFDRRLARYEAMTEKSSAEFDRKMAESRAEADKRTAEFDRRLAESEAKFDRMMTEARAEDARRRAEEDARRRAEEDARRRAEEDARRRAEEDARRRAEEAAKRKAEADRQAEEDAKRRAEEAAKRKAELDESFRKLNEQVFGTSQNAGYHAEQYFQNALKNSLVFGGEEYDYMLPNLKYEGRETCEFDMVLVNGKSVAIIEAKNRIHPKFVSEMVEKKVAQFRKYFPMYGNYKLYLGIAGFSFDASVVKEAKEYGIGILRQEGDAVVESDTENLKAY